MVFSKALKIFVDLPTIIISDLNVHHLGVIEDGGPGDDIRFIETVETLSGLIEFKGTVRRKVMEGG